MLCCPLETPHFESGRCNCRYDCVVTSVNGFNQVTDGWLIHLQPPNPCSYIYGCVVFQYKASEPPRWPRFRVDYSPRRAQNQRVSSSLSPTPACPLEHRWKLALFLPNHRLALITSNLSTLKVIRSLCRRTQVIYLV